MVVVEEVIIVLNTLITYGARCLCDGKNKTSVGTLDRVFTTTCTADG